MSMGSAEADTFEARLQALAALLRPGGQRVTALRRLSGGASQESWYFEVEAAGVAAQAMVLRRASEGSQQRAAGGIGLHVEAQLLRLAAAAGVPVPAVTLELQAAHGLGAGFVMPHVAGETLGRKIVGDPGLSTARAALARQCGQALARIHRIERAALPPMREAAASVELAYYEARHRSHGRPKPVFELALKWLKAHDIGAPSRMSLVHGDFRNGNLIVDAQGLRAVLDWELAHVGDPMEDLGWVCVKSWRFGRHDLPVGGFGSREALFAGYREAGGVVDAQRVHFWEVLGTLKWGVMCEGMAAAYLSGAERHVERAAIGRRASETEIDLLSLLAPRSQLQPADA